MDNELRQRLVEVFSDPDTHRVVFRLIELWFGESRYADNFLQRWAAEEFEARKTYWSVLELTFETDLLTKVLSTLNQTKFIALYMDGVDSPIKPGEAFYQILS